MRRMIYGWVLIFMVSACGCQAKPDPLAGALPSTPQLTVYEGLPHPRWESQLLAAELKAHETIERHEHPFYPAALPVSDEDAAVITAELRNRRARTPATPGTLKACGGFHPDYAICWSADKFEHCVLVCFGCLELEYYRDQQQVERYDLRTSALLTILRKYRQQRPASEHLSVPDGLPATR